MPTRLELELQMLAQKFPQFRIQDANDPERGGLIGQLKTNRGTVYAIWLALGHFPNDAPRMYIVSPKGLRDHSGTPLNSSHSASMHLLSPDSFGHPQICHYNDGYWYPGVSLSKILLKGRIWLEAYENHLATGKPLDDFLGHMGHGVAPKY